MANSNSYAGIYNVPGQICNATTEFGLLVPAAGIYPGYPSPILPAASGLSIGIPNDISGNLSFDKHPIRLRVCGTVKTASAYNVTLKLYQVPAAGVGVISATGSVTSAGAPGSSDVAIVSAAATSVNGTVNFQIEAELLWDSVSKHLNGYITACQIDGANVAPNSGTAGTNVATTQVTSVTAADLNFLPSVTFATASASNTFTVSEFVIDRS